MAYFLEEETVDKVDGINALYKSVQPKVLVVDDDHMIVQVISRMVEVFSSRIDSADSGLSALNYICESRYDVVIADLEMSDLSGYILACWMREKSTGTKIIIMTDRCRDEVAHYMKTGIVDRWVFKPFSVKDMKAALNHIMERD